MDLRKLTTMIVIIIVGVVMVIGVMIPILDGLDDGIKSVEQNTNERFIVKNDSLDLIVDCVDTGIYEINGKEFAGSNSNMIIGNGLYIYLYQSNYTIVDSNNNLVNLYNNTTGRVITIDDGIYNYTTTGGETVTGEIETLLYQSVRGDYGMFQDSAFSADIDDQIYLIGNRSQPLPKFVLTVENGTENRADALLVPYNTTPAGAYEGTVTVNIQSQPSEDGLSRNYTSVQVTAGDTTFSPIIYAPIKYHVVDQNAEMVKNIIWIIPLIIIISLLIIAGYAMMEGNRGRDI